MTIDTVLQKKTTNQSTSPVSLTPTFWATNNFLEQFLSRDTPASFLVHNNILDYVQALQPYAQQAFYTKLQAVYTDLEQAHLESTPKHNMVFSLQKAAQEAVGKSVNGHAKPAVQLNAYVKQLINDGYAHK